MTTGAPRLPLDVARRGAGPPLVLLHGFGANRFTYRFWADELARTHDLHLMDLFGFGTAPPPPDRDYGPVAQADAVVRYLREQDLRGATLIGHSLGGGIALLAALRLAELGESDRLAALVNIAGPAFPQGIPKYIRLARLPFVGGLVFLLWKPEKVVRMVLDFIVFDKTTVTDEQVEGYAAPLRGPTGRRALVQTARQILPPDLDAISRRFGTIAQPVLLLWGRHDHVIPLWVGERLARALPRARMVVLERCGHDPAEELPEESLAVVREFLAEVRAS